MFTRTKWAVHFRRIELVLCLICIILGGIIIYNISSIFCPVVIAGVIFFICCVFYICRRKYEDDNLFSFDLWVIVDCIATGIFFLISGYLYTASIFYNFDIILIFAHVAVTTAAVVFLLDLIFTIWSEAPEDKSVDVEDNTTQTRRQRGIPSEDSDLDSGFKLKRTSEDRQLLCQRDPLLEPAPPDTSYKCEHCRRRREEQLYLCDEEICRPKADKSTQFEKEFLPDQFCRGECETCDDKNMCSKMECYQEEVLKDDKTTQFNSELNPPDLEFSNEDLLVPKPNEMCILECENAFKNLPGQETKATQITTFVLQPNKCDKADCYPKFGQTVSTQCSLDNLEPKYSDANLSDERVIKTHMPRKFGSDKETQVSNIKECKNQQCGIKPAATSERYTETIGDLSLLGLLHFPERRDAVDDITKTSKTERQGNMDSGTQMSEIEIPARTTRSEITQTSFDKILNALPKVSHREIQTSGHLFQRAINENSIRINPEKIPVTIVVEYDSVSDADTEREIEEYDYSLPNSHRRCEDLCKENYRPDEQCAHKCCKCYTTRRKRLGIKVGQYKENEIKNLETHSTIDCKQRHCGNEHETSQSFLSQQPYANKSRRNGLDTPIGGKLSHRSLTQDSPIVRQASPIFRFVTPINSRNTSPGTTENTSQIMDRVSQKKLSASNPNSITFNR